MTSATRLSRGHGVPTDHTHAVKNTVRNMVSNLESVINNLQGVVGDLRVLVHQIDAVSNRLDDQYSARWKMSPSARRPWPPSVARRNGSLARETVDPTSAKGWQKLRDSFDSPDYSPDIDWSYLGLTGFDGFLQQQQDKLEQKQKQQRQLRLQKEKLQEKLQEQEQRLREQRERERQLQDSKPVFSFKPQRVPAPSAPCSNRPSLLQSPDKLGSGASFVGKSYHHHHHHHRKHVRLASNQKHASQAQTRHSPTLPRIESGGSESSSAGTTPTSMSTSASSSSVTSHVFCDDVTTGNEGADGKYCGFYEALMESELEKLSDCEAEGNFSDGEAAVGDEEEEEEEEEVVVSSRTSLSDSPVLSANYNRHVNPWTSFGLVHIDSAQESDDVVSESASDILNDNYIDSSFACTNPGFDSNFDGEIRI